MWAGIVDDIGPHHFIRTLKARAARFTALRLAFQNGLTPAPFI
jgi:hypothetical protein